MSKVVQNPEPVNTFNQMCYEILIAHKNGKEHLKLLEAMLMRPVFVLGKDTFISAANEGRNDFIRNMINGAHHFMNNKQTDNKVKQVNRTRKDVTNV